MALTFDIPEGQIRDAIAVAIAESFSPERREAIIRDVVRAHLQIREGTYDKETLLSKQVGAQIRQIAQDEVKIIISSLEPAIRERVRKTLGEGFSDSVLCQLENALSCKVVDGISVSVSLSKE